MRRVSTEATLVFALVGFSVVAGAASAAAVSADFEERVEAVGGRLLSAAAHVFAAQEASEVEKLAATLDALMASRELREPFLARDRTLLQSRAEPLLGLMRDRNRITHWYFHEPDPSRAVFLRVHKPELHGDRVERATLVRAAESGVLGAGLELGKTAFALRAVRPWLHEGKVIGYMELAEEIDHFLVAMKERSGDDYALLVSKQHLDEGRWRQVLAPRANSWNDLPDVVMVDNTGVAEGIADFRGNLADLPDDGQVLGELVQGDRAVIRGLFPVRDATGRKVGALFVAHDFTAHHEAIRAGRWAAFAIMLLASLFATGGVALLAHALVFRRLRELRVRLEARASTSEGPGGPASLRQTDDLARIEALFDRHLAARPSAEGSRDEVPRGGADR